MVAPVFTPVILNVIVPDDVPLKFATILYNWLLFLRTYTSTLAVEPSIILVACKCQTAIPSSVVGPIKVTPDKWLRSENCVGLTGRGLRNDPPVVLSHSPVGSPRMLEPVSLI